MSAAEYQTLNEKLELLLKQMAFQKERLTPDEAANYMGVHVQHVYDLISGDKPILRSSCPGGKKKYIAKADLLEYLDRNQTTTAAQIDAESNKVAYKKKAA